MHNDEGATAMTGRSAKLLSTSLPARGLLQVLAILVALLPAIVTAARAETPAQHCRRVGNDDTLRPIPASLVPAVQRLFGLSMPAEMVQGSTSFRCMDGHVLVCTVGANLPCGKANTSRKLPGATAFCRDNPGADFIPAMATGHDTIYQWRCAGDTPQPGGPVEDVDQRGFFKRYWKEID